ncbi:uncharacterized protein G2W53_041427 [Senna tora]|uniref:Uncharacterized protein n=1 Tax=Senna tora TaxID=362788 RepID=A0A834SFN9_9FABA|nr:uncharacterized protein G2W53_041427 [Senna tora]
MAPTVLVGETDPSRLTVKSFQIAFSHFRVSEEDTNTQ